jgi:hypothetical protein
MSGPDPAPQAAFPYTHLTISRRPVDRRREVPVDRYTRCTRPGTIHVARSGNWGRATSEVSAVHGPSFRWTTTGSGLRDVETLHRIDEDAVKQEITAAGFKFDGESNVLRNPVDARDWNASPKAAADTKKRGTSDRFIFRFVKP